MKVLLIATFAGGCFWCMQPPFDHIPGIVKTTVGYMGGYIANPTYEQVSEGNTGHAEAMQVEYDPSLVSYETLLEAYWKNIDPTVRNRQFADIGPQYRTVIFYHNETQHKAAIASKKQLEASKKFKAPVVTEIVPATTFYPAEGYHQCYYKKNPEHYNNYKVGSGRAKFMEKNWGKSH